MIAPAEPGQAATAFLEEGEDGVEIVERFDAVTRVVGAAAIGPARVAFLEARAEGDDVGAALRPALRRARNGGGEADLMEKHGWFPG